MKTLSSVFTQSIAKSFAKKDNPSDEGELPHSIPEEGESRYFGLRSEQKVLVDLEKAYRLGATDEEACCGARITLDQLEKYQRDHEAFISQKKVWQSAPILVARETLLAGIEKDAKIALDYLKNHSESGIGKANVKVSKNSKKDVDPLRKKLEDLTRGKKSSTK